MHLNDFGDPWIFHYSQHDRMWSIFESWSDEKMQAHKLKIDMRQKWALRLTCGFEWIVLTQISNSKCPVTQHNMKGLISFHTGNSAAPQGWCYHLRAEVCCQCLCWQIECCPEYTYRVVAVLLFFAVYSYIISCFRQIWTWQCVRMNVECARRRVWDVVWDWFCAEHITSCLYLCLLVYRV